MRTVGITSAKAQLSCLVKAVAAGETVTITKNGKPLAQLTAVERPLAPVDIALLEAVTSNGPFQTQGACEFIRSMRDDDRY